MEYVQWDKCYGGESRRIVQRECSWGQKLDFESYTQGGRASLRREV